MTRTKVLYNLLCWAAVLATSSSCARCDEGPRDTSSRSAAPLSVGPVRVVRGPGWSMSIPVDWSALAPNHFVGPDRINVLVDARPAPVDLVALGGETRATLARALTDFEVLSQKVGLVGTQRALELSSRHLHEGAELRMLTVIVDGDMVKYVLTVSATARRFEANALIVEAIVRSFEGASVSSSSRSAAPPASGTSAVEEIVAEGEDRWARACEGSDAESCYRLALLRRADDPSFSHALFARACGIAAHPAACYFSASTLERDPANRHLAIAAYRRSCRGEHGLACARLDELCNMGGEDACEARR